MQPSSILKFNFTDLNPIWISEGPLYYFRTLYFRAKLDKPSRVDSLYRPVIAQHFTFHTCTFPAQKKTPGNATRNHLDSKSHLTLELMK